MDSTPAALVAAFAIGDLPQAPQPLPSGTICAMTGQHITTGYPRSVIITSTTADLADTFPFRSGFVASAVARAFKSRLTGHLAIVDGVGLRPTISRGSDPDRPAWTDLLRQLRPGQQVLLIMSDETQRRLWPRAQGGGVGPALPILLKQGTTCQLRTVDHVALITCLDLIERIYAAGWSKASIGSTLLSYRAQEQVRKVGIAAATNDEGHLRPWRSHPAFAIALASAQKPREE